MKQPLHSQPDNHTRNQLLPGLEVRRDIRKGGESRAIDLKGAGKRSLRKIDFWYETSPPRQG